MGTQPDEEHGFALAASRLEQRAKYLNWLSWGYLVAIVVALVTAVFVFIYAPNVTNKDLARGAPVSLQALRKKQEQITLVSQHTNAEISVLQGEAAAIISPFVRDRIGRRVDLDANTTPVNTCCDVGNYPTFTAISDAIRTTIEKGTPYADGNYALNGYVGYNISFSATMSKDQWLKISDDIAKLKFPLTDAQLQQLHADAEESSKLSEELTDNSSVILGIRQEITNAEIEQDTGRSPSGQSLDNITILKLIQTTITRFGTITIIVFLVGILSGLYRYTAKLVSFYLAQADALRLANDDSVSVLQKFSKLLTPQFDFGRNPSTPIEQIAKLADAMAKLRKDDD